MPSGVGFSGSLAVDQTGQSAFTAVPTAPDDVNNVLGLGVLRPPVATEFILADGFEE